MYPTLYHALYDILGVRIELLKLVNTFGFMVALAFIAAARTLSLELARREQLGQFAVSIRPAAAPPPLLFDAAFSGVIAFLLGFKLFGVLVGGHSLYGGVDAQHYLLSWRGHWPLGVMSGLAWAAYVYVRRRGDTASRAGGDSEPITFHAADHTMGITTAAAIGGFVGAKVFHWLEEPERIVEVFTRPSIGVLFGGLTIYGGLLGGALAVYFYCRRNALDFARMCDATAPGLMLAYGVGRLGCQLSGDGDWGITNPHPLPSGLGWLPEWLWAYDYPNNVLGLGVPMAEGGFPGYGTHLQPPVYPTPLYEAVVAVGFFAVLWRLRLRALEPLVLFGAYLAMNGFARFWIEKIRVNARYELLGFQPTQAELIATLMFVAGMALMLRKRRVATT